MSQRPGRVQLAGGRWQDPACTQGSPKPVLGGQHPLFPSTSPLCLEKGTQCFLPPVCTKVLGWWVVGTQGCSCSPCSSSLWVTPHQGGCQGSWVTPQHPEVSWGDAHSVAPSAKLQSKGILGLVGAELVEPGTPSPARRVSGGACEEP